MASQPPTTATPDESAADAGSAPAPDPRDPPASRRENFRGCSIAVPDYATREELDAGMRVLLPTDTGATVSLVVLVRRWSQSEQGHWAEFERGVRDSVAQERGEVISFQSPQAGRGAGTAIWHRHVRNERRVRARIILAGRRQASVSCSVLPARFGERERTCASIIESLSLGAPGAPAPREAPAGMRWVGERGVYVQVPDGWLPQGGSGLLASVVEDRSDSTGALVEVDGGESDAPLAGRLAEMRENLVRAGLAISAWAERREGGGVKVDYEGTFTSTEEQFVRQRFLVRGWRLCVVTCVGPEDFVRPDGSFCAEWLPTLRVDR